MVSIDNDLCTACGICVAECPRGALSLEDDHVVVDGSLCSSCGACVDACPNEAITLNEIVTSPPLATSARAGTAVATRAGAPERSPERSSSVPTRDYAKRELAQKAFSGLWALVGFLLERERVRPIDKSDYGAAGTPARGTGRRATARGGGRSCPGGGGRGRSASGKRRRMRSERRNV